MKKINKTRNLLIVLIGLILIYITSIYLWNNRSHLDAFFLNHISELLIYQNSNHYYPSHTFKDFPFGPYFILVTSKILNIDIIDVSYLPLVPFLSFFSLLVFGKAITNYHEKEYFFIVSFSIFIYYFILVIPYMEYYIGLALYPLFLWAFIKYLHNQKTSFLFILILIFMGIHFYAIPISTWIIVFMTIFAIFIGIAKKQKKVKTNFPLYLLIIFFVIWFFWNEKFLFALYTWEIDFDLIAKLIRDMFLVQSSQGFLEEEFLYKEVSSNIVQKGSGVLYLLLIIIPIFSKLFYEIIKRNVLFFMKRMEDIFIFSLLFPFLVEFIIYGSRGFLSFRYLHLIFPFISLVYMESFIRKKLAFHKLKKSNNKYRNNRLKQFVFKTRNYKYSFTFIAFLVLMIFSSSILRSIYVYSDSTRHLPESESGMSISKWYISHVTEESALITDYNTQGYIRYYLNKNGGNEDDYKYHEFTTSVYEYLVNSETNSSNAFNYLLIDNKNINRPLNKGPPVWNSLIPLKYYMDDINNNNKLNKVYVSNHFIIYNNNQAI